MNRREQQIVARFLAECHLPDGSVLDVPCGYGCFIPLLTRHGMTITAVDVNPEMVQLAVENHGSYRRGRWLGASIFDLPFGDDTFDAVLCIRLLHHRFSIVERQRILTELSRVSRRFVLLARRVRRRRHGCKCR